MYWEEIRGRGKKKNWVVVFFLILEFWFLFRGKVKKLYFLVIFVWYSYVIVFGLMIYNKCYVGF